jgi:hypothetical protein
MQPKAASRTRDPFADVTEQLSPRLMRHKALGELDAMFKQGRAPEPAPEGFLPGALITMSVSPTYDAFMRRVSGLYMPWLGKSFDRENNQGINVLTKAARSQMKVLWPSYEPKDAGDRLEAFEFRTRTAPGAVDPSLQVLKIDYDFDANPSFMIRRVLDELVQIDDGVYLGKILFKWGERWRPIGFFSLQSA